MLTGGKRPFHTIIPAFMEKGDLHLGFGIMGGATQPLAHAQFVSNIVDYNMNLQEAMEAPGFSRPTHRAAMWISRTVCPSLPSSNFPSAGIWSEFGGNMWKRWVVARQSCTIRRRNELCGLGSASRRRGDPGAHFSGNEFQGLRIRAVTNARPLEAE